MKVTDKKFLNVHQTISPLSVATTVTASSTKGGESSPSSKAEKILVSFGLITRKNKRKRKRKNTYNYYYCGKFELVLTSFFYIKNQLTHVNFLDGFTTFRKIDSV